MVRKLAVVALFPLFAAVTVAGAFLFFYPGRYDPPASVDIPFQQITSPGVAPGVAVDSDTAQARRGLMLMDALHVNSFEEEEVVTLKSWGSQPWI